MDPDVAPASVGSAGHGYGRHVLSSFDDYPIHQTSRPVAHPSSGDVNCYDRYFFNGYSPDGALYFALAMGLYPNRHVADAAFSVVVDGAQQVNVHASMRAPDDRRAATSIGPIRVEVIEPLRVLRLVVDAPEHGLRADLTFRHRSAAYEEPHFFLRSGVRVMFDYTRLTQFGTWEGWVEVDGARVECSPTEVMGSRDRSWGVRPVGERVQLGAPTGGDPQFFWLWAPLSFPGFCTHFDVNEEANGHRWHEVAALLPVDGTPAHDMRAVDWSIDWEPGTRNARTAELRFHDRDGATTTIELVVRFNFQMLGIGYGHPEWSHGVWKGELAVGGDRWTLPVPDPCAFHHIHVQAFCEATCTLPSGEIARGAGILEQMVLGAHAPSGFTDLLGPATRNEISGGS